MIESREKENGNEMKKDKRLKEEKICGINGRRKEKKKKK